MSDESSWTELLKLPVKQAAKKGNRLLFAHRKRIYDKFVATVEQCTKKGGMPAFEARTIADYEMFCLRFAEVQYELSRGSYLSAPMYASPKQTLASKLVDTKKINYLVWNRQTGKTLFAGTKGAQIFLRDSGSEQNFLAPRISQLRMFTSVYKILSHEHILDNYLQGGIHNVTKAYSPNIKSTAEAKVLGDESQYRRGSAGISWVDEAELVDEQTKKEVVAPLQANPDAATTIIFTLTPKLSFDPHLGQEIAAAIVASQDPNAKPSVGYLHSQMFEAMLEGRTSQDYIMMRFGDGPFGLHIPCPYGKLGHCPKYYRECFEADPEIWREFAQWSDFRCNLICKRNVTLLQEDWAEFPTEGGRFFSLDTLTAAAERYSFKHYSEIDPEARHIVSCDWGLVDDPMCIQVWEKKGQSVKLIYWELSQKGAHLEDEQLNLLKKIFCEYKGDILMVDVTEDNTFLQRNLSRPSTVNERYRIPASKIWQNDTAKQRDFVGIVVKGPFKSSMYSNWRSLLMSHIPVVPDQSHEPEFWDAWFEDHFSIEAEPAHEGQYYKFGRTGHTVDAAAMAGLAISGAGVTPVYVGLI